MKHKITNNRGQINRETENSKPKNAAKGIEENEILKCQQQEPDEQRHMEKKYTGKT